jgi:excisionase family DNA binding protein
MIDPIKEHVITTGRAAWLLGCSLQTVRSLIRQGRLEGFMVGKHFRTTIEACQRHAAKGPEDNAPRIDWNAHRRAVRELRKMGVG